jgi:DNA-binding transcriptional MerR regulator
MAEAETRKEAKAQASPAGFWLDEIQRAGKREADWRKEGKAVIARYRNDKKRARSLNILWANVELLKPAVLARTPKPDVRQRFPVENPVAKQAADVIERALAFIADDPGYGLMQQLEYARDDMLLPGRGVVRLIYERDMRREQLQQIEEEDGSYSYRAEDGTEYPEPDFVDENGFAFREEIARQEIYPRHVYWEDYREGDARCWEDVPWIAYRHTYTRKQLVKAFGDIGKLVPLTLGTGEGKGDREKSDPDSPLNRAIVWEVWDKQERNRLWVAESYRDAVLAEDGDPLGLDDFYPQPDPLYAIRTSDCRVPVPEFRVYKDQADELDDISLRIKRLIDALKARGVYAAVMKEAADLLNGDENELIPVEDWAALKERGGLEGCIAWLPIEQLAKVVAALYQQREQLKAEIYELTGISDLLRGDTDPNETATAQQIKGNFGQIRLEPRQAPMQRFARDLFRIAAEIIAEHFTAEQLALMTGEQVTPEVMALLRSDKLRNFSVDIETDSTVAPDEQAEKQNVSEFMSATADYFTKALPIAMQAAPLAPLVFEIYRAGAKRFRLGRELDEVIDQVMQQVVEQAAQPPQPQPDPKLEAEKFKAEAEMQKAQFDLEAAKQRHAMDLEKLREQRISDAFKAAPQIGPDGQPVQAGGGEQILAFTTFLQELLNGQREQTQALIQAMTAPKQIMLGPDGMPQAVVPVTVQ